MFCIITRNYNNKKTIPDGDCLIAEKEGFEPSRRVNDLLPFQGSPFSLLGTSPKSRRLIRHRRLLEFATQTLY